MTSLPMSSHATPPALGAPEGDEIRVPPPSLSVRWGAPAFAFAAVAFGALAAWLYVSDPSSRGDGVLLWGGVAALSLLGAIVTFIRRARLRFTARMYQHGFQLDGQAFRFDDLESLALPWGPAAWFTKDALEIKRGVIGKNIERLPLATPVRATMKNGSFQLHPPHDPKTMLFAIPAASENFFPGLLVMQKHGNIVE
jgi:hypothetical protein